MEPEGIGPQVLLVSKIEWFIDLGDPSQPAGLDPWKELDLVRHELSLIHFFITAEKDLKMEIRRSDVIEIVGV